MYIQIYMYTCIHIYIYVYIYASIYLSIYKYTTRTSPPPSFGQNPPPRHTGGGGMASHRGVWDARPLFSRREGLPCPRKHVSTRSSYMYIYTHTYICIPYLPASPQVDT